MLSSLAGTAWGGQWLACVYVACYLMYVACWDTDNALYGKTLVRASGAGLLFNQALMGTLHGATKSRQRKAGPVGAGR